MINAIRIFTFMLLFSFVLVSCEKEEDLPINDSIQPEPLGIDQLRTYSHWNSEEKKFFDIYRTMEIDSRNRINSTAINFSPTFVETYNFLAEDNEQSKIVSKMVETMGNPLWSHSLYYENRDRGDGILFLPILKDGTIETSAILMAAYSEETQGQVSLNLIHRSKIENDIFAGGYTTSRPNFILEATFFSMYDSMFFGRETRISKFIHELKRTKTPIKIVPKSLGCMCNTVNICIEGPDAEGSSGAGGGGSGSGSGSSGGGAGDGSGGGSGTGSVWGTIYGPFNGDSGGGNSGNGSGDSGGSDSGGDSGTDNGDSGGSGSGGSNGGSSGGGAGCCAAVAYYGISNIENLQCCLEGLFGQIVIWDEESMVGTREGCDGIGSHFVVCSTGVVNPESFQFNSEAAGYHAADLQNTLGLDCSTFGCLMGNIKLYEAVSDLTGNLELVCSDDDPNDLIKKAAEAACATGKGGGMSGFERIINSENTLTRSFTSNCRAVDCILDLLLDGEFCNPLQVLEGGNEGFNVNFINRDLKGKDGATVSTIGKSSSTIFIDNKFCNLNDPVRIAEVLLHESYHAVFYSLAYQNGFNGTAESFIPVWNYLTENVFNSPSVSQHELMINKYIYPMAEVLHRLNGKIGQPSDYLAIIVNGFKEEIEAGLLNISEETLLNWYNDYEQNICCSPEILSVLNNCP